MAKTEKEIADKLAYIDSITVMLNTSETFSALYISGKLDCFGDVPDIFETVLHRIGVKVDRSNFMLDADDRVRKTIAQIELASKDHFERMDRALELEQEAEKMLQEARYLRGLK